MKEQQDRKVGKTTGVPQTQKKNEGTSPRVPLSAVLSLDELPHGTSNSTRILQGGTLSLYNVGRQ